MIATKSLLRVSILFLFLLNAGWVRAQAAPPYAGIAPAMQEFVDRGEISGIVTLVADKDHILHLAAVGESDLATGRKMQTDDYLENRSGTLNILNRAFLSLKINLWDVRFRQPDLEMWFTLRVEARIL